MNAPSPFDIGSHSIAENLQAMRITPDSDLFRGIDLCTQFITYWDQDFNMVDLNRSLFVDGMVDHSRGRDLVMHHHISEFLPDLLSKGLLDDVMRVHKVGGNFVVDDYQFMGFNLKHSLKCTMTIAKISDYTIITGENITKVSDDLASSGSFTLENDYAETIENLYRTIDVLARRFSVLEQAAKDNCMNNIESTLAPLIEALSASKLDERQRIIVDTMQKSIASIANDYDNGLKFANTPLTARETEIAKLIKLGKTTKDIANILCLSERTVESHRANIRKKLGIKGSGTNLHSTLEML